MEFCVSGFAVCLSAIVLAVLAHAAWYDRKVVPAVAFGVAAFCLFAWLLVAAVQPLRVLDEAMFELVDVRFPDGSTVQMWSEGLGQNFNATSRFQTSVDVKEWRVVRTRYVNDYYRIQFGQRPADYRLERKSDRQEGDRP